VKAKEANQRKIIGNDDTNRLFYELCYDTYKEEIRYADVIYKKAVMMLIFLGILTIAAVDIFAHFFAPLVAMIGIINSTLFLFICIYPRKYQTLASMKTWLKWQEDYCQYLNKRKGAASEGNNLYLAATKHLCEKLAEAQAINAAINERRLKAFKYSVMSAAIAFAAIFIQAILALIGYE